MKQTFNDLMPNFILDNDNESVIDFHWGLSENNNFYYIKRKYLPNNEEESIFIHSLWCADLDAKTTKVIFPFTSYVINYTEISSHYLYFACSTVAENNGFFRDTNQGKIFRINKTSKEFEDCMEINSDYFHGFEAVSDSFLVFRYEDHMPEDVTEIIVVDLESKRMASILDHWGPETEYNYEFVKNRNGEINYILIKRWTKENAERFEDSNLKCFIWGDFIKQLNWIDINL